MTKKQKRYGRCPRCGSKVVRLAPVTHGVCRDHNPVQVVALFDYAEFRRRFSRREKRT